MPKPKVLYICHNHPSVRPGGAEAYALELYEAIRDSNEFEPVFLAKGGPPMATVGWVHQGTPFFPVNDDPNQHFFYTDVKDYDCFYGSLRDKEMYTKWFHGFLLAYRPDVVHFQHTHFLGYDLIRQTRNTLPTVPIVYTLQEFLPICHRNGQMVRTVNEELCHESSPRRCHECFPEMSPQAFFMRKRFIQSHLAVVDLFLVPSRFLLERYVQWGISPQKIRYEEYGRRPVQRIEGQDGERPRSRLGFFGQLTAFKGADVLLQAMKTFDGGAAGTKPVLFSQRRGPAAGMTGGMGEPTPHESRIHLWLHGANLELQPAEFQSKLRALLDATRHNVTFVGRYHHRDLPRLMANIDWVVLPSIWWENSPLVIQEAFQFGRPVICSDIGGMAEKVTHGVNGLQFRTGDPVSLAETIRRAVSSQGLWQTLRNGIPDVYEMEDHVRSLTEIYRGLLDRSASHDR